LGRYSIHGAEGFRGERGEDNVVGGCGAKNRLMERWLRQLLTSAKERR